MMLNCEERIRIIKGVAFAVLYLHEGWEEQVLHRDIKASNVLLDKDMNGKLGDFGLARMNSHGQVASTTKLVGTVGYMAPEVIKTGQASTRTDVYMFGILILEVMCGRRPMDEGKPPLVEFVWGLMVKGELMNALDERLSAKGDFNLQQVEKVLQLGLLCAYPEPKSRPNMRQVKANQKKKKERDPLTEPLSRQGKRRRHLEESVPTATEEGVYQPKTKETRAAYEAMLSVIQQHLGRQPLSIVSGAADEILAVLKNGAVKNLDKKKEIEKLLNPIPNQVFERLYPKQC
ncbi:hypothetical protein AHAS_Ahas11G0351400 [Arachis hypogaea]